MEIRLGNRPCSPWWTCRFCGSLNDDYDLRGVARDADGNEFRFVCSRCMLAGPNGIKRRVMEKAERTLAFAKYVENQTITIVPSREEMERMFGAELPF